MKPLSSFAKLSNKFILRRQSSSKKLFSQLSNRPGNFLGKVECILLSGKDERVTKADAAVICEFHEGWLVDMDEGRGEGYGLNEEVISI